MTPLLSELEQLVSEFAAQTMAMSLSFSDSKFHQSKLLEPWVRRLQEIVVRHKTGAPVKMPRVVITGSRDWADEGTIRGAFQSVPVPSIVGHGAARGADTLAARVATELGHEVVAYPYFDFLGKAGGPARNEYMLSSVRPDLVLAFPTPSSVGTVRCTESAQRMNIPVLSFAEKKT